MQRISALLYAFTYVTGYVRLCMEERLKVPARAGGLCVLCAGIECMVHSGCVHLIKNICRLHPSSLRGTPAAVCRSSLTGSSPLGSLLKWLWVQWLGRASLIGHNYMGQRHTCTRHNYTHHNCIGHKCTGHNCIGHNCIGHIHAITI